MTSWLIGIAVIVAVILVAVVNKRRERERTEGLRRVAETAGLAFKPEADVADVRSLGEVQLYARGHTGRVTNLMTGVLGDQQVAAFDYQYTIGSGKNARTTVQTVVVLPSVRASLPDLQMAPENPLTRMAEVFGYQDIDIEPCPEFSRRYIVKGPDAVAIRAALYPVATAYFAEHEGWTVEAQSGTVAIYRANSRPKTEDMRAFIEEAFVAARNL
jgi:hypothetical protein